MLAFRQCPGYWFDAAVTFFILINVYLLLGRCFGKLKVAIIRSHKYGFIIKIKLQSTMLNILFYQLQSTMLNIFLYRSAIWCFTDICVITLPQHRYFKQNMWRILNFCIKIKTFHSNLFEKFKIIYSKMFWTI